MKVDRTFGAVCGFDQYCTWYKVTCFRSTCTHPLGLLAHRGGHSDAKGSQGRVEAVGGERRWSGDNASPNPLDWRVREATTHAPAILKLQLHEPLYLSSAQLQLRVPNPTLVKGLSDVTGCRRIRAARWWMAEVVQEVMEAEEAF